MQIQPYLYFEGRCDEAIEFYQTAVDAKVTMLMRYRDAPGSNVAHGTEDKVMHANLEIGGSTVLFSDGRCSGQAAFQGFGLSLVVDTVEETQRYFAALSEGGNVVEPLTKTFFSPSFGMVTDKFGVFWLVYANQ